MGSRPATRRTAVVRCAFVAAVSLACACLLTTAALAPAPVFLAVTCVGMAMAVATELPELIAVLRRHELAVATLRGQLAELPETEHPLGL
jgi:hypothetical protein